MNKGIDETNVLRYYYPYLKIEVFEIRNLKMFLPIPVTVYNYLKTIVIS